MAEIQTPTEVLDGLVEVMTGEKIGRQMIHDFVFDDSARIFLNEGAPYSGKTTVLEQEIISIEQIKKANSLNIAISTESYEEILMRNRYPDSVMFNQLLVERYLRYKTGKVLGELPACGDMLPKDRGVTAGRRLALRSATRGWYLVPNYFSKLRAAGIRTQIPDVPDEKVLETLDQKYGVNVVLNSKTKNQKKIGRKIKIAISSMAKKEHVLTINKEIQRLWMSLSEPGTNEVRALSEIITSNLPPSYQPEAYMEEIIRSYEGLANLHESEVTWDHATRMESYNSVMEAAFMEYSFRGWGVPSERFKVMFNPPQSRVTWYFRG